MKRRLFTLAAVLLTPLGIHAGDEADTPSSVRTQTLVFDVHSAGLFLTYTRRGANNDHIMRNRAPVFIAQVDPAKLHVIRATERILIPERGAMLGNVGATDITPHESWVSDAEFILGTKPHPRGADGTIWAGRVLWSAPNRLVK